MTRKAAAAAILLLATACAACGGPISSPQMGAGRAGDGFERGVVFGLFARSEASYARRGLDEIRALGAESVSIVIPWVTPDVRSLEIAARDDMTPGDRALRRVIRMAHRRGMTVFLLPLIYVDRMAEGEWRGTIEPPEWGAWFEAYGKFILHYAAIAEEEDVRYLSVGSELCSTERRREDWLRLIARVRAVYRGALTYSANWDHLDPVSFLDALDYAGMNAYFEVARDPGAKVEEMRAAWKGIIEAVEAWRTESGKRLILTEVGYPSRRGACTDPWNYGAEAAPDPEAQERCYRAFVEAWTGHPALEGVYFYIWWGEGGPDDTGYTPRGKPAEQVLAAWFRR